MYSGPTLSRSRDSSRTILVRPTQSGWIDRRWWMVDGSTAHVKKSSDDRTAS